LGAWRHIKQRVSVKLINRRRQLSSEDGERDFTSCGLTNSSLMEVHLWMNGAGSYIRVLDRLPMLDT